MSPGIAVPSCGGPELASSGPPLSRLAVEDRDTSDQDQFLFGEGGSPLDEGGADVPEQLARAGVGDYPTHLVHCGLEHEVIPATQRYVEVALVELGPEPPDRRAVQVYRQLGYELHRLAAVLAIIPDLSPACPTAYHAGYA